MARDDRVEELAGDISAVKMLVQSRSLGDDALVHIADAPEGTGDAIDEVVYELTRQLHGAISAEHGVGLKKRAYLGHTRSTADVLAMRAVKRALDAGDILNRGKVFTDV